MLKFTFSCLTFSDVLWRGRCGQSQTSITQNEMIGYILDLKIQIKQGITVRVHSKGEAGVGKPFLERPKSTINILTHEAIIDSHNPDTLPLQNKSSNRPRERLQLCSNATVFLGY